MEIRARPQGLIFLQKLRRRNRRKESEVHEKNEKFRVYI